MYNCLKKAIFKFFHLINSLPFNNMKKGKIKIINKGSIFLNCKFVSFGNNNCIEISNGSILKKCKIVISGNNNRIIIGENCKAIELEICMEDSNNKILIGSRTIICGKTQLALIEGTNIAIGDDCLFSSNIVLRTGDSHSILDLKGNRINYSNNITISEHVWIGNDVKILKGSLISKDSIVGTGTVITKKFDQANVVLAGIPADIVKENVNWDINRKKNGVL